ncbi:phospholipid-transporting ATPase IF-like isoform X1 [Dreissena polymorpha]|uniref:phospholipid-transporting ATPase IF-like isoform X1 n=1 Tax=Dreissena polymorpha TaxID=45954 RepID=UPI002264B399|nr:phospholipid-transporting ATPase IF-like isoform X1 [Dreissena polymorpha]
MAYEYFGDERAYDKVWPCFRKPPRSANRSVFVGHKFPTDPEATVHQPELYPENQIISSRYTIWNFLPKNLFEQFRRVANFYFLIIGIVQLLIDTPVSPITSILPLIFVVTVTAIKQGYEDWLRHKADREVNYREVEVIRNGQLTTERSMDIKVGDILKIPLNKSFPCDLVMLSSADPDGNCYITTANLDGETNLKTHCCIQETRRYTHPDDFSKLTAIIECQQPIPDLYSFIGNLTVVKDNGEHTVRPLGPEHVLLRGARLKNTAFIYGCAIYTGNETKLALNSKPKQTKFSRVERRMNTFLLIFLVILALESIFSTCMKYWYAHRPRVGQPWYVPEKEKDVDVSVRRVLEDFLSFVVLFNYVIPISLYVTIEVQKFVGSMFFNWDIEMYDPGTNESAKANTSDLNEELGQVEYLFTDKTGTLTENEMQFRMCSINGVEFEEVGSMLCRVSPTGGQPEPLPAFTEEVETFLTVLVLCHSVRVDHPQATELGAAAMYSYSGYDYDYQAPSPDEKAFVEACRRYGVVFHGCHDGMLEVTFKGEMRRYKLHHTLEFDATRKRMSVIVQNENDEVYLLCKGAESSMLNRAVQGDVSTTLAHVNKYAVLGLRTLVIGLRRLSKEEFSHFDTLLDTARTSLQERASKLSEAFDFVEKNLNVLGATAVEDKLQDEVPETIQALLQAGIKVWVLTGDKEETAVNISHSAGHFTSDMVTLNITQQSSSLECADLIRKHAQLLDQPASRGHRFGLVIDGASLAHCLVHSAILSQLALRCNAVLCCRMTPLQKAEVVKLIKHSKNKPVTAAIGDGANDVSMIEEADVGIGIMGKEGRQAVRNSDYAFARFRFLQKALLVHGHFYYIRLSNLVQYFFYKNVAFITAQLFYTFFSAFSQQSLYESFYLMNFNMVFTAMPILMYGIFEQHLKPSVLLGNPKLYRKVSKNKNMSVRNFILWNSLGLWHCAVMFFGAVFLMGEETSVFPDGRMIGNWTLGSIVYFGSLMIVCLKLCLTIHYWSPAIWFGFAFFIVTYTVGTGVYNSIIWPSLLSEHNYLLYDWNTVLQSASVWLAEIGLITLALLPDIVFRAYTDISTRHSISPQLQFQRDSRLIPLRRISQAETTKFIFPPVGTPHSSPNTTHKHTKGLRPTEVKFSFRKQTGRNKNTL